MKKIISILAITLIVSCKKENSCECFKFVNDSTGSHTYKYEAKGNLSKRKLKQGACASYTLVEYNQTTSYSCNMN